MKIRYNLDNKTYTRKPTDAALIRDRLCAADHIVETDPTELLDAIEHGQTFTPGAMTGTSAKTWISQQIIVADIDNDTPDKKCIENPLLPDIALSLMSWNNIIPYAMYYTFSNKEDHPKYRIMVILSEPIRDAAEAVEIKRRFTAIFNNYTSETCADTSIKDNARLIYGSTPGSVFYKSGEITPLSIMQSLPPIKEKKTPTQPERKEPDWDSGLPSFQRSSNTFDLLEPLSFIPADEYDTWIKCGMALKTEGYTLADWESWSRTSSKYEDGDCARRWETFSENESGGVTGAYITALAKKYGYVPPRDRVQLSRTSGTQNVEYVPLPTAEDAPPETTKQDVSGNPKGQKQDPVSQEPEPSAVDIFDAFLDEIRTDRFEPISTGIDQLDKALSGGLERKTLVTLAAAPGTGKTAIAQYILENMAENDHDVVYVNLEMDVSQLLSRSISRLSHRASLKAQRAVPNTRNHLPQNVFADISAIDVRRGYNWTEEQSEIVKKTAAYYREHIAPRFRYVTTNPENKGSIENTLSDIMGKLEAITAELIRNGKTAPLVCIDYLQFVEYDLMGENEKRPDNAEAIKQTLKAFKSFAMKYNTVVILITANNRASNAEGRASMDSARDTSNIEYSGDVMLSLVYTAVEEYWLHKTGTTDRNGNDKYAPIDNDFINRVIDFSLREKQDYPLIAKLLSLKVVKGRGIQSRGVAKFVYDGKYFYFEPDTGTKNPYCYESDNEPE